MQEALSRDSRIELLLRGQETGFRADELSSMLNRYTIVAP